MAGTSWWMAEAKLHMARTEANMALSPSLTYLHLQASQHRIDATSA